jgi:hypothetical protein
LWGGSRKGSLLSTLRSGTRAQEQERTKKAPISSGWLRWLAATWIYTRYWSRPRIKSFT